MYKDNFAAGTAFIVIRRSDAKGLQLSKPGDHAMIANVQMGMSGWVWTSLGVRIYGPALTNPVWIAVNMLLRARGLRLGGGRDDRRNWISPKRSSTCRPLSMRRRSATTA